MGKTLLTSSDVTQTSFLSTVKNSSHIALSINSRIILEPTEELSEFDQVECTHVTSWSKVVTGADTV